MKIEEIAKLYILLPSYIHSVDLVRWMANFRNNGLYNKDTYFIAMGQIKTIIERQKSLIEIGKTICPTKQQLRFMVQQSADDQSTEVKAQIKQSVSKLKIRVQDR